MGKPRVKDVLRLRLWLEFSQSDNGEAWVAFRAREGLLGPQTGIVDCVEFPSGLSCSSGR